MTAIQNRTSVLIAMAMILTLIGGNARGQGVTNYWTGAASSDFNTAGNWSQGTVPSASHVVAFTNVSSSIPVHFTANALDYQLLMLNNTSLTFDLNGNSWTNVMTAHDTTRGTIILTNATSGVTRFSSTVPGGRMTVWDSVSTADSSIIGLNPNSKIIVDDSLGAPVVVSMNVGYPYITGNGLRGTVVVSGPGSQFNASPGYTGGTDVKANIVVTNQGFFSADQFNYGGPRGDAGDGSYAVTTMVINATMKTGSASLPSAVGGSYKYPGTLILSNNSTWTDAGAMTVGNGWDGVQNYQGKLLIDQSTYNGQSMTMGGFVAVHNGVGFVQVANDSTMVLSNGYLLVSSFTYNGYTNTFYLDNSTLKIGKTGANGVITNMGVMRASGTITGQGAGNLRFVNWSNSLFSVGSSIGTVTVNKGDVAMVPTSKTLFEFGFTGLDQIVAANGSVSLLGTNLFSLAAGSPSPVPGVKYGLGLYDFAVGTNVTWTPQYDNLVNLLTNTYGLTYGVDFQYGVVNLGGGLFALELVFVPEPSTVMLLALGGLMVWRRFAKGRRKAGKAAGAVIACGLILALAGGTARGQSPTNYWEGDVSSDFNTAGNWGLNHVPTTSEYAAFTNVNSATPVTFSAKAADWGLLMLNNASITFNLSGQTWSNYCNPWNSALPALWLTNNTPGVMKVSSQGGTGYLVMTGSAPGYQPSVVGLSSLNSLIIDDSLGSPAVVTASMGYQYYVGSQAGLRANVVVGGPGSQFIVNTYATNPRFMGSITVSNQASFIIDDFLYGGPRADVGGIPAMAVTATVINASMKTGVAGRSVLGGGAQYPASVILSNNSTWTDAGTLTLGGGWDGTVNYQGKLVMNQSTYNGQAMTVGDFIAVHNGPGYVEAANGSTVVLSNGYLLVSDKHYNGYTNTFILNNSTLKVGRTGVNGVITNQGIVRASGTITGQGAANFKFVSYSNSLIEVGSSIGQLTLNKGDLELKPTSKTLFEFGFGGLDQIIATNGYASLLGTNLFSLATGSPSPVPGVKYGLGVYDFVIGTNVTWNPQYDNLTYLLTNTYHLIYGVDFQYGVANLGGGLFALELMFVPEPSTVMLLVLGVLMVWRRMSRKAGQ